MSKFLSLAVLLAVAAVMPALHAEDKVLIQITPEARMRFTRGKAAWSDGVLKGKLPLSVSFSDQRFKVDPSKIYTLSGEFRLTSGGESKDNMWFGLVCFDEAGRDISSQTLNRIVPDLVETAETAPKGAKVIVVKGEGLGKWMKFLQTGRVIAVGAKADRSDLPNFDLLYSLPKGATKRADGSVEIKLRGAVNTEIPAGTKLGLHSYGDSLLFTPRGRINGEWRTFSGSFAAKPESGVVGFRPTTRSISFGFFCRDKEGEVEVRNLKLVESED